MDTLYIARSRNVREGGMKGPGMAGRQAAPGGQPANVSNAHTERHAEHQSLVGAAAADKTWGDAHTLSLKSNSRGRKRGLPARGMAVSEGGRGGCCSLGSSSLILFWMLGSRCALLK